MSSNLDALNNPWRGITRVTQCPHCKTHQSPKPLCGWCGKPLVCGECEGDGYIETWNDDQSDVVITLCPYCGHGAEDFDG